MMDGSIISNKQNFSIPPSSGKEQKTIEGSLFLSQEIHTQKDSLFHIIILAVPCSEVVSKIDMILEQLLLKSLPLKDSWLLELSK